jgi:hypothetical protein
MLYTYNRKMPSAYTVKPFMQVLLWLLFMLYVSASAMFVGDEFFGIIAEEDVVVMQTVALFFYIITACAAFHTLSEFYCSLFKGYKTIFGMQALSTIILFAGVFKVFDITWVLYYYFFLTSYMLIALASGYTDAGTYKIKGWED